jgi:ketosteroid isomerase-like protein
MSGTWAGRDVIMDEFFATAMANYEPGTIDIDVTALLGDGDHVVLQWTTRTRTRDGRPYENGCIGLFTVRDGKIQAVREYMDTLYASSLFSRTEQ